MKTQLNAFLICFVILLSAVLSGCGKKEHVNNSEKVLYIASANGDGLGEAILDNINEYLKNNGCEYSVEQVIFGTEEEYNKYSVQEYCREVMGYIKEGNPIDLCYAAVPFVSMDMVSYDIFIDNELLEPLDEYLSSDEGQILYNSIPKARWESVKRNGHIYGVNGYSLDAMTSPAFVFNKQILDKYGYTADDVDCNLEELAKIIRHISEGEADNKNYKSIVMTTVSSLDQWHSLYIPNPWLFYVGINENGKVESFFDNDEYKTFVSDVFHLAENSGTKVAVSDGSQFKNSLLLVDCWAIPGINPIYSQGFRDEHREYGDVEKNPQDYVVTYPYGKSVDIIRSCIVNNCVIADSKNKEWAYDFLTRVYSDVELTDLIMYGEEGVSHEKHDGLIYVKGEDWQGNEGIYTVDPSGAMRWGNSYISTPSSHETADKETIVRDTKDLIHDYPYYSYFYKLTPKMDIYNKVMAVCDSFLARAIYAESFDKFYEDFLHELDDAGMQELVNAIQSDFDEWRQSQ